MHLTVLGCLVANCRPEDSKRLSEEIVKYMAKLSLESPVIIWPDMPTKGLPLWRETVYQEFGFKGWWFTGCWNGERDSYIAFEYLEDAKLLMKHYGED